MNTMVNPALPNALIVDDEVDICYLLSGMLRNLKFNVQFVNSIAEAKTAISVLRPALLFLDNHLTDGMGIDLLPALKAKYPDMKVVMISAYDSHIEQHNALKNGADYFIGKPFTKAQLTEALYKIENAVVGR